MSDDRPTNRIETALLELAATRAFRDIRLAAVAERAGVGLAELRLAYDGPLDIVSGFCRRIDVAVLEGVDASLAGEPVKDRLFDALMRRFDLLAPYRAGLAGLEQSARRDPVLALHLVRLVVGSQAWLLEAAGVAASGPLGAMRALALTAALHRLAPTFFADTDPGLSKTMAALDAALERLGSLEARFGRRIARLCGGRRRAEPVAESPVGDATAGEAATGA